MNYESFVEHVKELMKDHLPEGWEKAIIKTRLANKVNQKRTGLEFDRGEMCSPTVYLEEFYERYKTGMNLEEILEAISEILIELDIAEKFKITKESLREMSDRIIFQLINTEANPKLLNKMPHRSFEDLSIIYLWFVSLDENGFLSIPVENPIANLFEYSEEQLFQLAYENTKRLLPPEAAPMRQMINELLPGFEEEVGYREADDKETGLYVFTNSARTFGSTALLYPEVFEKVAEIQGDDLYIMPTSRHEVVSLPKGERELQDVIEMVEMSNEIQKDVEQALSHQVYLYDRGTRTITKVSDVPFRPFGEINSEPDREEVKERNASR